MVGVIQQQVYPAIRVTAADTVHIPQVGAVHADQQVKFLVISFGKLPRRVTAAGDPVFDQLAPRRRIDGVAELLAAGCGGLYIELCCQSCFFY